MVHSAKIDGSICWRWKLWQGMRGSVTSRLVLVCKSDQILSAAMRLIIKEWLRVRWIQPCTSAYAGSFNWRGKVTSSLTNAEWWRPMGECRKCLQPGAPQRPPPPSLDTHLNAKCSFRLKIPITVQPTSWPSVLRYLNYHIITVRILQGSLSIYLNFKKRERVPHQSFFHW